METPEEHLTGLIKWQGRRRGEIGARMPGPVLTMWHLEGVTSLREWEMLITFDNFNPVVKMSVYSKMTTFSFLQLSLQ